MPWYCICDHLNQTDGTHCESCKKEKTEKLFPLWQRAMHDPKTDYRKYAEPVPKKRYRKKDPGKDW